MLDYIVRGDTIDSKAHAAQGRIAQQHAGRAGQRAAGDRAMRAIRAMKTRPMDGCGGNKHPRMFEELQARAKTVHAMASSGSGWMQSIGSAAGPTPVESIQPL
jgi:hypothetical protein